MNNNTWKKLSTEWLYDLPKFYVILHKNLIWSVWIDGQVSIKNKIIYYEYLKYIKKNTNKKSLCDKEEYFVADHYWGSANSHTHSKKIILKLNWKEANSDETMSEKM